VDDSLLVEIDPALHQRDDPGRAEREKLWPVHHYKRPDADTGHHEPDLVHHRLAHQRPKVVLEHCVEDRHERHLRAKPKERIAARQGPR
jgi:hypothetical protein